MTDPAVLHDDILAAARTALAAVRARHGDDLRAMALYSDDDAMTVCEAFDTHSHLAASRDDDPDELDYRTFSPAEWAMEGNSPAAAMFDDLSRRAAAGLDETDRESWTTGLFETCVRVLEALRADAGDLLLLFTVTDGGHRDEPAWMRRTSPAHAARFETYLARHA
ncbi:DUF4303 domain-containing protein [Nocardioides sp. C4-1]|uniref:DUF4303 domain-containing protein n=1 Tax=Nocardioides sp. C4-1 TaxID=3151851 RepID=UPI0032630035